MQLTKLCNIVTTIRIYTALHTIQNFPLVDKITGVAGAAIQQRTGTFVIPAAIQKIIEQVTCTGGSWMLMAVAGI